MMKVLDSQVLARHLIQRTVTGLVAEKNLALACILRERAQITILVENRPRIVGLCLTQ